MGRRVTGELRALSPADLGEEENNELTEAEKAKALLLDQIKHQYVRITGEIPNDKAIRHLLSSDVRIFGEQHAADQESHARDALEMSEIAPKELKLAMLFHDIGKAGPEPENNTMTKLVASMYAYNFPYRERKTDPTKVTLSEFLIAMSDWIYQDEDAENDFGTKEQFVETALELLSDIPNTRKDTDEPSVRDFYDYHVQMGVEMNNKYEFIDAETAFVGFGHHLLPGRNFTTEEDVRYAEKTPEAKVPYIEGFTPTIETIKLAAGAQALDYCNAVYTRRMKKGDKDIAEGNVEEATGLVVARLSDAVLETEETLHFGLDNDGYDTLIDVYKKKGIEVSISNDDIEIIKQYIKKVLQHYTREMITKHT